MNTARAGAYPSFDDPLLDAVTQHFQRRRKSIAHGGAKLVCRHQAEPQETVKFELIQSSQPRIELELARGERAHLYVHSARPKKRNEVLLRREHMRLLNKAEEIVEAFEWTATASRAFEEGAAPGDVRADIEARWSELELQPQ